MSGLARAAGTTRATAVGALVAIVAPAITVPLLIRAPLVLVGLAAITAAVLVARLGATAFVTALLVVLAAAPTPDAVPISFTVRDGTLYLADLVAAVLFMAVVLSGQRAAVSIGAAFVLVCGVGTVVGLMHGLDVGAAVRDLRGLGHGIAVLLGSLVLLSRDSRKTLQLGAALLSAVVVWSGIAALLSLRIGGDWLNGRALDAALYGAAATGSFGVTRLLLVSGPLCAATAAFCIVVLAWGPSRGYRLAWLLGMLATSLLVLLFTYSRNNLVTVGAAILLACFLTGRRVAALRRLARGISGVAATAGLCLLVWSEASPGARLQTEQVWSAFTARVVNGLNPTVLSGDASTVWRQRETALALDYSLSHPLTGSGFGAPYRAVQVNEPFWGDDGTTYVHNTFLWLPVKLGWVIGLLLLGFVVAVLVRRWRQAAPSSLVRAAACTLLALVPAMVVSPLPFTSGSAVVVALLVALCVAVDDRINLANPGTTRHALRTTVHVGMTGGPRRSSGRGA